MWKTQVWGCEAERVVCPGWWTADPASCRSDDAASRVWERASCRHLWSLNLLLLTASTWLAHMPVPCFPIGRESTCPASCRSSARWRIFTFNTWWRTSRAKRSWRYRRLMTTQHYIYISQHYINIYYSIICYTCPLLAERKCVFVIIFTYKA